MNSNEYGLEEAVLDFSTQFAGPDTAARAVPTHDLYLRLLSGREAVPHVEKAWDQVVARWPDRQFFHLYAWHKSYIEAMGGERHALFVLIYHRYRPIGVIPLRREQRMLHRLRLRTLAVPTHPQMPLSDLIFHGIVIDSAFSTALIELFRLHGIEWDVLEVKNAPARSSAFALLRPGRPLCHALPSRCCDYIPSMVRYRDKARQAKKCLPRAGAFAFSATRERSELHAGFDRYLNDALCDWRTTRRAAPGNATFFRRLIDNFAAERGCELHLLNMDGAPVAALLALVVDRRAYALRINADPDYDRYAPGWILLDHWIKQHLREGRTAYLLADAKYRQGFDPLSSDLFDLRLYNATAAGWAAYALTQTKYAFGRSTA